MKSSVANNIHYVKLEKDDEIISSLLAYINEYLRHKSGTIQGIGTVRNVDIGFFKLDSKSYEKKLFSEEYEILSLQGNFGVLDGYMHPHLHIVIGDKKFNCIGGHLFSAVVTIACELFIVESDNSLVRTLDPESGLKLLSPEEY